jgi:uncharacterized membrane protein YbhN (UPF0104 family)
LVTTVFVLSVAYLGLFKLNIIQIVFILIFVIAVSMAIILFSIKKFKIAKAILDSLRTALSNKLLLAWTIFLTVISWCVSVFIWMLVAETVGLSSSFFEMFSVISGTALVTVLIFIPGAIGSMELSNIFLIGALLNATSNQAIMFALAIRVLTLVFFAVGYLHLLIKSKIDKAFQEKPNSS